MQDIVFSGFVTRKHTFSVIVKNKRLLCSVKYYAFVLWVFFSITWGEQWKLIGDKRSEDKQISYDLVKLLVMPHDPPKISFWEKYSFLLLIGIPILVALFSN